MMVNKLYNKLDEDNHDNDDDEVMLKHPLPIAKAHTEIIIKRQGCNQLLRSYVQTHMAYKSWRVCPTLHASQHECVLLLH